MTSVKRSRAEEDAMAERMPVAANPSSADSALLSANGLLYRLPQTLSTTNFRNNRKQYSDKTDFQERETFRFIWNTGSAYIDPDTAFLTFKVNITNDTPVDLTAWDLGGAGAASLISEILIQAKNGKELDRVTHVDKLAAIRANWLESSDGRAALGAAGFEGKLITDAGGNASATYAIPLSLLSGFFRPIVKGTKIPANLCAGLFIQLTLNSPTNAFVRSAGTGTGIHFSISNPEIYLQSSILNDPTQATLLTTSAQDGLEYVYTSTYADQDTSTATSYNQVSKKAVSQCLRTFAGIYPTATQGDELSDSFATVDYTDVDNWQWRLGSSYYPQNPVTVAAASYWMTAQTFDRQRSMKVTAPGVSYADYITTDGLIGVPVSSESRLLLSGSPINNSNVLELQLGLTSSVDRTLVIWMEYVAVAKAFLNYTDLKL